MNNYCHCIWSTVMRKYQRNSYNYWWPEIFKQLSIPFNFTLIRRVSLLEQFFIHGSIQSSSFACRFECCIQKEVSNTHTHYSLPGSMLQPTGGLLQPQPLNAVNNNTLLGNGTAGSGAAKPTTNVGTTWKNAGNVNIDLDNLLGNTKGKNAGNAPSMNQMKSIHSSPVHPMPMPPMMQQSNPTTAFGAFPATPQPTSSIPPSGPGFMGQGFMNGLNNNSSNNNSSSLNFGAFQWSTAMSVNGHRVEAF